MRRRGALVSHFLPQRKQALAQLRAGGIARATAGAHHEIHSGEIMLVQSKGLTNRAAQTIALNGTPGVLDRDGQSQARSANVIGFRSHREKSITKAPSARVGG